MVLSIRWCVVLLKSLAERGADTTKMLFNNESKRRNLNHLTCFRPTRPHDQKKKHLCYTQPNAVATDLAIADPGFEVGHFQKKHQVLLRSKPPLGEFLDEDFMHTEEMASDPRNQSVCSCLLLPNWDVLAFPCVSHWPQSPHCSLAAFYQGLAPQTLVFGVSGSRSQGHRPPPSSSAHSSQLAAVTHSVRCVFLPPGNFNERLLKQNDCTLVPFKPGKGSQHPMVKVFQNSQAGQIAGESASTSLRNFSCKAKWAPAMTLVAFKHGKSFQELDEWKWTVPSGS